MTDFVGYFFMYSMKSMGIETVYLQNRKKCTQVYKNMSVISLYDDRIFVFLGEHSLRELHIKV